MTNALESSAKPVPAEARLLSGETKAARNVAEVFLTLVMTFSLRIITSIWVVRKLLASARGGYRMLLLFGGFSAADSVVRLEHRPISPSLSAAPFV